MRRLVVVAVGPIEGISAGLLLSELVGVVGFLLIECAVEIRFLPVVLGTERAVATPVLDTRVLRTPG